MKLLSVAIVIGLTTHLPAPPKGPRITEIPIVLGTGKGVEDPKILVPQSVLAMDKLGQVRSDGALLGQFDLGVYVSGQLKKQDVIRLRIDLDEPSKTPATIVLKAIDEVRRATKDGKRVELKFTYESN